jgi:hypothetical protein
METVHRKYLVFMYKISRNLVLLKSIFSELAAQCIKPTLIFHISLILRTSITIVYVRAERIDCVETDMSDIASSFVDLQTTPHIQAKPSQSVNWGAETCAKRKSTSPCLLAIPAFDRIAGL